MKKQHKESIILLWLKGFIINVHHMKSNIGGSIKLFVLYKRSIIGALKLSWFKRTSWNIKLS